MNTLCAILMTVLTTFSDGTFHTTYETSVDANVKSCNQVVDSLIFCLQNSPEMLSEQFFAGLGKQGDKNKNAFYLVWKESSYIPEKRYSKIVMDVLVDEKPYLRDVVIESMVVDSMVGRRRDIRVDIQYAGHLLQEAYGTFHVEPIDNRTVKLSMDVHVKFGWFFRIFISQRIYRNTIDWRLERFVTNLKLMAEGKQPTDAYWQQIDKEKNKK